MFCQRQSDGSRKQIQALSQAVPAAPPEQLVGITAAASKVSPVQTAMHIEDSSAVVRPGPSCIFQSQSWGSFFFIIMGRKAWSSVG